jgi:hypothetical protein
MIEKFLAIQYGYLLRLVRLFGGCVQRVPEARKSAEMWWQRVNARVPGLISAGARRGDSRVVSIVWNWCRLHGGKIFYWTACRID